jgi:hypothetical protein
LPPPRRPARRRPKSASAGRRWGNTLAETQAHFGATSLDHVTITFDAGRAWDTAGFLDIMQHEFGHALGLVDMYHDSTNSVIDFVDHPAGGDKAAKTKALVADNVMYGYGSASGVSIRLFDNDDMYGANWLFGGPINAIATAEWRPGSATTRPITQRTSRWQTTTASPTAPPRALELRGVDRPAAGKTLIQIPPRACGRPASPGPHRRLEHRDPRRRGALHGAGGLQGQLLLSLTSDLRTEDLVEARVNSMILANTRAWAASCGRASGHHPRAREHRAARPRPRRALCFEVPAPVLIGPGGHTRTQGRLLCGAALWCLPRWAAVFSSRRSS